MAIVENIWVTKTITDTEVVGNRDETLDLPTLTKGALYQNAATPQAFTVSYETPTQWNNVNAGTITAGNMNGMTADTTTGELTLDQAGNYALSFSGSLQTTTADVQLCAQLFLDGVAVDNICDFPASRADGKYTAFGVKGQTLAKVTAGQKLSLRFLALDGANESMKLRFQGVEAQRID